MAALIVVRPGMLTTVQDLGRWGHQHLGIPVAGPMDWYSHRLANRLVGNGEDEAALEITLLGPELLAKGSMQCAIAGAEFDVRVDDAIVRANAAFEVRSGQHIRFGARRAGTRTTLAVRGGLALDATLGSRSMSLISRMGPFGGRPLAAGDVIPVGSKPTFDLYAPGRPLPMPRGGARVRVVLGPHEDRFTEAALGEFRRSRFTITPESNRMGYRLEGPPLEHAGPADILSDATPMGSLQVPGSGQPILLMADRQTTGGYPKIATVISADLPLAGQLAPGDWIEFEPCSRETGVTALRTREAALQGRRP